MSGNKSSCASCSGRSNLGQIQDSPESKMEQQDKLIVTLPEGGDGPRRLG